MVIDLSTSALIAIDVQKDFCPGGALAVQKGDEVVGPLNALARRLASAGGKVVATQDWHPPRHVSFASAHPGEALYGTVSIALEPKASRGRHRDGVPSPDAIEQTLWPDHCVAGSAGAAFHQDLDLAPVSLILRKGSAVALDSYSAFFENDRVTPTGLEGWLRSCGISTVFLGGLATDYCVFYSAMDASSLGFETILVDDACRGVGVPLGSVERAMDLMRQNGVLFMTSEDLK